MVGQLKVNEMTFEATNSENTLVSSLLKSKNCFRWACIIMLLSMSMILCRNLLNRHDESENFYFPNSIGIPIEYFMNGPYVLKQDDPYLKELILKDYLVPPSTKPYNMMKDIDRSQGQTRFIRHLFKNKTNGIFVEAGAYDGESLSNTYHLESRLGWTGLLIEANPQEFERLVLRHRKAWLSPLCVATVDFPVQQLLVMIRALTRIENVKIDGYPNTVPVQCVPLFSILNALDMTKIDYLSLDVEGIELAILKTLPWERLEIAAITVEFAHGQQTKEEIFQFLVSKGYQQYRPQDPELTDMRITKNRVSNIDLIMFHPQHHKNAMKSLEH